MWRRPVVGRWTESVKRTTRRDGDTMPERRTTGDTGMTQGPGELDGVIKARKAFFAAERALVKASGDYEKARTEYERACSQLGLTPHYAPGRLDGA